MESASRAAAPGVVVIGRNEGARLGACLDSVVRSAVRVVYVDSGSTDASVAIARGKGVSVLELDPRKPFSAARARNEGFERLRELHPEAALVQFVDGDCELAPGWLEAAARFLDGRPDAATVCGRLRERHPGASIYNALCDIEWNVPPGESQACGGNFMVRAEAFERAGGFRADLQAGEEPELARRLAGLGWRTWRVPGEMALHDAAMLCFPQWWRRTVRNGYGFGQGFHLARSGGARLWARELRSAWLWAFALPIAISLAVLAWGAPALFLLLLYPLQVARLAFRMNAWSALLLVVGKFAEFLGHLKFLCDRHLRDARLHA
jgi:glycosyltransferase involved in cell wall biosynthesis